MCGIEVKSGSRTKGRGMDAFKKKYPDAKLYVVTAQELEGSSCIGLEEFLGMKPDILL